MIGNNKIHRHREKGWKERKREKKIGFFFVDASVYIGWRRHEFFYRCLNLLEMFVYYLLPYPLLSNQSIDPMPIDFTILQIVEFDSLLCVRCAFFTFSLFVLLFHHLFRPPPYSYSEYLLLLLWSISFTVISVRLVTHMYIVRTHTHTHMPCTPYTFLPHFSVCI